MFGDERADEQLERYHELEPELEADGKSSYREVLTEAMRATGGTRRRGGRRSRARCRSGSRSRRSRRRSRRPREQGWKLAILSNTDRDYIEASMKLLGVPFELAIVASEIGSYKPGLGHWRAFQERIGRAPDVHVAASLFHDIAPANELGLPSVWINRLGETPGPKPTKEQPDLAGLAGALEEVA